MRKLLKNRLGNRRGFTVAELLVTVLILLMVTGVVAAGVPTAANAYSRVMDTANAQLLLSTTMTALRTQLESARSVALNADDGTLDYYQSERTGITAIRNSGDGDEMEGIWLEPYQTAAYDAEGMISGHTPDAKYTRLLISYKAAAENLHAKFKSITYADGLFTVTGLQVVRKDGSILAGEETDVFYIRAVNIPE